MEKLRNNISFWFYKNKIDKESSSNKIPEKQRLYYVNSGINTIK